MFERLKDRVRKNRFLSDIYRDLVRNGPRHSLQNIRSDNRHALRTLGSSYGGWTFLDDPNLQGSMIISAGLGEDASFDVEFAQHYGAKVVLVDPTPRAIAHYREIETNFGEPRRCHYTRGGKQPVESYDLRGLNPTNFSLIPKALWNTATKLKFFEPTDRNHVSHSIVNFQRGYADDDRFIEVDSVSIPELLAEISSAGGQPTLIKLDIEGAEIEVIADMIDNSSFRPTQILVEFDELNIPSRRAFERVDRANAKLVGQGYQCIYTDGRSNFLYIREGVVNLMGDRAWDTGNGT